MPQLDGQYSTLNPIHPFVVAEDLVRIFCLSPMGSKHFDKLGYLLFIGTDRAGFSIGPKILARIKTESAYLSNTADLCTLIQSAMCLSTILDESEAVLHRNTLQLIKLTRYAIQVHNDKSARLFCDGLLDGTWVNFPRISKRIDEHGFGSRIRDTRCARNEGMSRDDDLIPGTDTECKERKMDGSSPTVYPEHVSHAAIIGELFFEPVNEFASREGGSL